MPGGMDHKRREGRDGVLLPLGKLAIHQTSRAVRYVPATHKRCDTNINHHKFSHEIKVKVPAKSHCACCKGYHYQKEECNCGEVLVIRAWLNQHRGTHTSRI